MLFTSLQKAKKYDLINPTIIVTKKGNPLNKGFSFLAHSEWTCYTQSL